jgi:pheromone shutdown protein TraB
LDKLLSKIEERIKEVVIDKRNREAAENARYALEETGKTSAMVQFGAGHTDGLVKEMNAQGLSVVVITSTLVAEKSYETLDKETKDR